MGRPKKPKIVCCDKTIKFISKSDSSRTPTQIPVEEYESIRLIDYAGLTQSECADMMGVSRSAIQQLYKNARHKLAKALVERHDISIKGGNYQLCHHGENVKHCLRRMCENRDENFPVHPKSAQKEAQS